MSEKENKNTSATTDNASQDIQNATDIVTIDGTVDLTASQMTTESNQVLENIATTQEQQKDSTDKAKSKGKKSKRRKDPNAPKFGKGLSYMFGFMRRWRAQVIVAIILSSFSVVFSVIAPSLLGDLAKVIEDAVKASSTNSAITNGPAQIVVDLAKVARFGIILGVMYGIIFLFNYLQNFTMAGVSAKTQRKVRVDLSKKINVLPIGYFDKNGNGDTLSRITNDTNTMGQAISENFSTTIQAALLIVGTIIAMFVTEWRLALIVLATVPLSFGLISIVTPFSQKLFARQRNLLGQLNSQIEENYGAQAVVLAYRGQKKSQAKFAETNKKLANADRWAQFLGGILYPIIIVVANLGYVFVIVFGVYFSTQGLFDISVIAAFIVYVRLLNNPLGQIAQGIPILQNAAAGATRIKTFLLEKEQVPEVVKTTISNVRGDVEFEHVKFGYTKERTIIKDFSASVKAGQKIAIVGPTGAGKTTLVNLLMRFYELDSGVIKIDGVPTTDISRSELRDMFGMVLQDTWLFAGTIKENIVYNKQGVTDEQIKAACKAANIHHFIKTLSGGYDHYLDDESNISSGQRQLLTIARAMVQDSPMLILDEATSNVDTRTEQMIQEAMDKVTKGRTSFVIAHRLSTIKNADLILVLKDGDIIEKGNHDELIAQDGFYCDLYNSQFSNEAE